VSATAGSVPQPSKIPPSQPLPDEALMNDIEVMYENNIYLVRFEDEKIHILIPALGSDWYGGDHYLGAGEKADIVALALNTLA
jgi:hypothetical protein